MRDNRTDRRPSPPAPRGWGGVRVVGGRVVGVESNAELRDDLWPGVARQMMRTDDAVQAGVEAIVGTLLSARWTVTPGDPDDPFSRRLADDLTTMLGLAAGPTPGMMTRGWEEIVAQLALAELVGFRYGEPRWSYEPGFGVILDDIEDRCPSAHRAWIMEAGRLVAVEQAAVMEDGRPSMGQTVRIPAENLILITRGAGNGLIGRGLLRGCFALWRLKTHLLDMMAVASERTAVGVPWLRHDWQAAQEAGIERPAFDADLELARDAMDDLVVQGRRWIETGPGIEMDRWGGELDLGKGFIPGLEYCDRGILRALLVAFLALGMSDASGSRALGQVTETFFRRAATQALDRQAGAMNGTSRPGAPNGIIGRWVEYNWGPIDPRLLPRMGHAGLTVHPLLELADKLDLGSWLPPSRADRAILRRELQMPQEEQPEPSEPPQEIP
ncbi:MAG: hypothetical protein R3F65_30475 [bacterium]